MTDGVLILDDSLTVRMDLAEAFEAAGFRTILCATIADAHRALAQGSVSLGILDVNLPDGDGVELLKEIRRTPATADLPILLLSSEAQVKSRIEGLRTGADDYVGKPYDTGYVVARARELVRSRHTSPQDAKETVLIVDDSLTAREELRRMLETAGYLVLSAADGEEGLRLAATARPSAVVVDGAMPRLDGVSLIRKIRLDAALRGTPCLMLTGSDQHGDELRALDAGADAFARKSDDQAIILARIAAVLRAAGKEALGDTASLVGPKRVLAVDDSSTYLQALAPMLRNEGFDVVLARSGEEALEMLSVQEVDCILMDLLMPGLGGLETCRRIKAMPIVRETPLIMVTGREERETVIESLAAGADDFIQKSSDFEILKARVRAQLRRKQFEDEHRRIREQLLRKELDAAEARAARKTAEARAALAEELQRKNTELEAFSYSVSHDLNAPLRAIKGFSQSLFESSFAKLDALERENLVLVRESADRMSLLIADMLKLARAGTGELRRSSVDLSKIARAITAELVQSEPDRRVDVVIADGLTSECDPALVRMALTNLLGNAWKFTSRRPEARIEFGEAKDEIGKTYFVRDNGAGFDMHHATKLFGAFQRFHSASEFPGTGIGLATVQRVIHRHGGRVWAEGTAGQGAVFFFTLEARPVVEPLDEPTRERSSLSHPA
jgi:two-component system NtrC family sensor kinase